MRSRTLVLILCLAAVFLIATVAIVPVCFELLGPVATTEPRCITEPAPSGQSVALAGDLSFRGPPVA
ncbi:MAG TPA: hypothetical protein VHW00_12855 [Thermoanaerobaculia bacterium]|nr:hypothetical protein [Thermoanaerobaculia bacterium]